jgi:uncharacterized protein (TIGR01777 family)
MRVAITGATGLIGPALIAELTARGDEVTVLSRRPEEASRALGAQVEAVGWDLMAEPAPASALAGRDAVVHLAGENVAQRWSAGAKQAIRDSRVVGTRHLLEGLRALEAESSRSRPRVLVSSSAIGYYGPRGEEPVDEEAPPGQDFLAQVCVAWEREAQAGADLGLRVVPVRTGVVLDRRGGALKQMLPPFRAGLGGPVAGGRQYISWIHRDDVAGLMIAALDGDHWSGPINATAPEPVTNREFSRALGRALHRPAITPVPRLAMRVLFGEMSQIVTTGARVMPAKPLVLGYRFRYGHVDQALAAALG